MAFVIDLEIQAVNWCIHRPWYNLKKAFQKNSLYLLSFYDFSMCLQGVSCTSVYVNSAWSAESCVTHARGAYSHSSRSHPTSILNVHINQFVLHLEISSAGDDKPEFFSFCGLTQSSRDWWATCRYDPGCLFWGWTLVMLNLVQVHTK